MNPLILVVPAALLIAGGKKKKKKKKSKSGSDLHIATISSVPFSGPSRPSRSTGGGSTRGPSHTGGRVREFKDYPTPGYWYRVRSEHLRPVVVKASTGSTIGVEIPLPDYAFAWRAYTSSMVERRPKKKTDLSKWASLNGLLGPRHGASDALGLLDEAAGAVAGGLSGDFGGVAESSVEMIQEVWKGVLEKQDAAEDIVSDHAYDFVANIASDPANERYYYQDDWGPRLRVRPGDHIRIPERYEYYRPSRGKPG